MRSRTPLRIAAAAAAALALTACVRIETPEPEWPSPSPAVLERDSLAAAHADLEEALEGASASPLATVETTALPPLVAGIGPAYAAYPDDEVEPYAGTLTDAAEAALEASVNAAHHASDADLRAWGASAALVHGMGLWLGSDDASGVAERSLTARSSQTPPAVPTTTALEATDVAALAMRHDEVRCLLDQIAMRTSGEEQADALARRDIEAARSDALQQLSATADARTEICSVRLASIADASVRAIAVRAAHTDLGDAYAALAVVAESTDVDWLLDGAFDAYTAAAVTSGWTTAELPTTPGLVAASDEE